MEIQSSNLELYLESLVQTLPDTMTPQEVADVVKIAPSSVINNRSVFQAEKVGGRYMYHKSDIIDSVSKCYKRVLGKVSR